MAVALACLVGAFAWAEAPAKEEGVFLNQDFEGPNLAIHEWTGTKDKTVEIHELSTMDVYIDDVKVYSKLPMKLAQIEADREEVSEMLAAPEGEEFKTKFEEIYKKLDLLRRLLASENPQERLRAQERAGEIVATYRKLKKVKPGDTVVVNGVGPIGLLTVALAKIGGASRVIAVGRKNRLRLDLARAMGADLTLRHADVPRQEARKQFVFDHSLNLVGADVVINTAGVPKAFVESIDYVRDSGTFVEVGNFVDSGDVAFNPCTQLLERGITIIGSFDNEAEHFVRSLPLVSDERIPLERLITHRLPLSAVQRGLEAIRKGETLDGREIVKIAVDPTLPE